MIERHGGAVEHVERDAIVAAFGLAELHEDDALRAARSAIDLHRSVGGQDARLLLPRRSPSTGRQIAPAGLVSTG